MDDQTEIVKRSGPQWGPKIKLFAVAFIVMFALFLAAGLIGCASTEGIDSGAACPTAREVMVRKGYLVLPGPDACFLKLYGLGEEPATACYTKKTAADPLWVPRTVFGAHCGFDR